MSMTLTIEIPALDRLCAILEQRDRENILDELKQEICRQLKAAATGEKTTSSGAGAPPSPKGEGKGPAGDAPGLVKPEGQESTETPAEDAPGRAKAGARKKAGKSPDPAEAASEAHQTPAEAEPKDVDVRAALNRLIKAGKRDAVKAILNEYGADNFTKLKPADYKSVLEKAREALGDG
ncbi:MAG: hypothetical protein J6Q14_01270 [Oscillospiraceae bacterium]|nr:hypothetical protein [Oscillospiraceae bacterium]